MRHTRTSSCKDYHIPSVVLHIQFSHISVLIIPFTLQLPCKATLFILFVARITTPPSAESTPHNTHQSSTTLL
ncbi:hypothetical protein E2C01_097192 [Portunus trituberculatus]|uniref:Uncharacterized protein n=1 Tax=Portunus trituberculatus TaxID=210409 RepID=A0A5B7KAK6_PORTR|nr:hypothetical protein [Portunus trituberculatus]